MKTRIFVTVIAAMLVAGCSAFDNSNKPYDGFGPDISPPAFVGGGAYEGDYKGEMALTENNCEFLEESVGASTPLAVNVIQSGELVSFGFEDESEASGSLDGSKTTIIQRNVSNTLIFHVEFTETGITGDCKYIDRAPVLDQLGEPCATYSVSLTKEE